MTVASLVLQKARRSYSENLSTTDTKEKSIYVLYRSFSKLVKIKNVCSTLIHCWLSRSIYVTNYYTVCRYLGDTQFRLNGNINLLFLSISHALFWYQSINNLYIWKPSNIADYCSYSVHIKTFKKKEFALKQKKKPCENEVKNNIFTKYLWTLFTNWFKKNWVT